MTGLGVSDSFDHDGGIRLRSLRPIDRHFLGCARGHRLATLGGRSVRPVFLLFHEDFSHVPSVGEAAFACDQWKIPAVACSTSMEMFVALGMMFAGAG
jgi:hypothetical protein